MVTLSQKLKWVTINVMILGLTLWLCLDSMRENVKKEEEEKVEKKIEKMRKKKI